MMRLRQRQGEWGRGWHFWAERINLSELMRRIPEEERNVSAGVPHSRFLGSITSFIFVYWPSFLFKPCTVLLFSHQLTFCNYGFSEICQICASFTHPQRDNGNIDLSYRFWNHLWYFQKEISLPYHAIFHRLADEFYFRRSRDLSQGKWPAPVSRLMFLLSQRPFPVAIFKHQALLYLLKQRACFEVSWSIISLIVFKICAQVVSVNGVSKSGCAQFISVNCVSKSGCAQFVSVNCLPKPDVLNCDVCLQYLVERDIDMDRWLTGGTLPHRLFGENVSSLYIPGLQYLWDVCWDKINHDISS